jgi:hypothetical protein
MNLINDLNLFFDLQPHERSERLLTAIFDNHTLHYPLNNAYRHSAESKGVGERITENELALILRPTAQVFKSYIDILGTPFPEDQPLAFLDWLSDNVSIQLPTERFSRFKSHYSNLEAFLLDIERIFEDWGFEIGTSSGTSGRATIMLRDRQSADAAVTAYKMAVYRLWGTKDDHQIVFVMPQETRIVMARVAHMATIRLGMSAQSHFTLPFSATPDQVRIRSGRAFKQGARGWIERNLLFPFMNWMNDNYVKEKYVSLTIQLLENLSKKGADVLLFGGWVQLDMIFEELYQRGYGQNGKAILLSEDSMIGTGGGMKEMYPYTPAEIKDRLTSVLRTTSDKPLPHRDVYGMAESNWAAAQCELGNYHLPPWLYAVVLDQNDEIIQSPSATGMLAFYDPIAGGQLYPNFFKTADEVHLINGGHNYSPDYVCECGYQTAYIAHNTIIRRDRLDEAGCAGQI